RKSTAAGLQVEPGDMLLAAGCVVRGAHVGRLVSRWSAWRALRGCRACRAAAVGAFRAGGLALHVGRVAPGGRQAIEPSALGIFFLAGGEIRGDSAPRLERGVLQRAAVAEGQ